MSSGTLGGPIGFAEVGSLLGDLDQLCMSDSLDLSAITQVDSAGLSLLLELTRRARRQGRELKLTNAPAQLRDLARFFKLDDALKL